MAGALNVFFLESGRRSSSLVTTSAPCWPVSWFGEASLSQSIWAAVTKYLRLINGRNLSLTVLATGKSKIKLQVDSVSGEGCSLL